MSNNTIVKLIGWHATILLRDPSFFDRWVWLRRHLLRGQLRTLDAGCGAGEFTLYMAKVGNHAIGLSYDEHLNHIARVRADLLKLPNVEFITADLRELDQLTEQLGIFDQIICFETIEHILNDEKLMVDLAHILKQDGRLLLTTPFKYHKHLANEKLSDHEDGGHVRWGYTHEDMRALFNRVGLEAQVEEYVTGFISQQIISVTRRLGDSRGAWAITFPLRIFQLFDPLLTRLLNYPYLSIAVVGIKRG